MRKLLFILAFAGVVLCQSSESLEEASKSDSDVEELEEPQMDKDTKKTLPFYQYFAALGGVQKKDGRVKQNVTKIINDLPTALAEQSAIIENEKLTRKEKHEALKKLVKEKPRLYRALKAIFHIVRPRRGPRFLRRPFPRRPSDEVSLPKGPKPLDKPEKKDLKEEGKKGDKPEENKKKEVPSKA